MRAADDDGVAARELRESALVRGFATAAAAGRTAARESYVVTAWRRGQAAFDALTPPARLCLVCLMLLIAILLHLALLTFVPRHAAPLVPRAVWAAAAAGCLALGLAARSSCR
jgi:drug/metabolite transporter (DMT)-like permease